MKRARQICGALLLLAGLGLGGYLLWTQFGPAQPALSTPPVVSGPAVSDPAPVESPPPYETDDTPPPNDQPALAGEPVPDETPPPEESPAQDDTPASNTVSNLPVGKLVVTAERKKYKDGNLKIYIPVINITRSIYAGTDAATLNKGVGLYEYAQLPGEGSRNVSLAGHRNGLSNGKITDRAPFYYIDTLEEGDYLYLYNDKTIYRYVWEYCEIVEPDDWGPIRTTDYSCLTITSCHPIGISDHRIVVRGKLDKILSYSKDFEFIASAEEGSE